MIPKSLSNHPELLDRAVWRRFQIRLELPLPGVREIEQYLQLFENRYNISFSTDLKEISKKLKGRNFGDVENFALSVTRRYVLSLPENNMSRYVEEELQEQSLNIKSK